MLAHGRNADTWSLARAFRTSIELALDAGEFETKPFNQFPTACCGDASDLLAQYLSENGICTSYVCGTYRRGSFKEKLSHAWLVLEDGNYLDITGDQFKNSSAFLHFNKPVYLGPSNEFYQLFDIEENLQVRSIYEYPEPARSRMVSLYEIIGRYIC